jgi:primase-polymerase (primpol)-like protein
VSAREETLARHKRSLLLLRQRGIDFAPNAIRFELIPEELVERKQWVIWRGKKVPYIATHPQRRASSTDPTTWSSFNEAYDGLEHGDGLGFVIAAADPYVCVDLDGCRDPDTGSLTLEAEDAFEFFNSYTEISVGLSGLHVWVKAELRGPRCRTDGVEIYSRSHYMTVTGRQLLGRTDMIEPRQEQLDAFYQNPSSAACGHLSADSGVDLALQSQTRLREVVRTWARG